jgi:hypothetical protein
MGWQIIRLICVSEKQKYFFERDWTGQISLIQLNKFDFARNSKRWATACKTARRVNRHRRAALTNRDVCAAATPARCARGGSLSIEQALQMVQNGASGASK